MMRVSLMVVIALSSPALAEAPPRQDEPRTSLFVACDNLLRCVRAPCPSTDIVLLPSGERLPRTGPRLDRLSAEDRRWLAEVDALYYGTVVLEGTIEDGAVSATRIVRNVTDDEAAMCRKR